MNKGNNYQNQPATVIVGTVVLVMALSLINASTALARATAFHDNFDVPVDQTVFSPCAGEDILFTGAFHVEVHTTVDASGGFHSQFTNNDHNVSGVGLSSGTKYRRVGATVDSFNASGPPPLEETFTNSFNFIGSRGIEQHPVDRDHPHNYQRQRSGDCVL
jgi:hypothetical protein